MEETVNPSTPSWFNDALKKGLILGGIHIFVYVILYVFLLSKLTGFSYLAFIIVLNVTFILISAISFRKEIGGYMDYGLAFKYIFVLLFFNGLLFLVFSLVLLVVDPTLPEQLAQAQMDTSLYWAQKMGAPESAMDQVREDLEKQDLKSRYGFSGLFMGFGIVILIYAVAAAVLALIARKNVPEV